MRIIPGHMNVQVERYDNASGISSILDQVSLSTSLSVCLSVSQSVSHTSQHNTDTT